MSDRELVTGGASGVSPAGDPLRAGLQIERIWKVAIVGVLFVVLFRQELLRLGVQQ